MKNLILIFLFILSVPVLSAASTGSTSSSSENGIIVSTVQYSSFINTSIVDTKKRTLEIITTSANGTYVSSKKYKF